MLLTLENLQNQQFNQRFRGYDMAEVDAFLDKIAESYLFVSTENAKLKEELTAVKNAQNHSLEEEQRFKNAIISAQSFADDLKNKAQANATRLQQDAKEKSTTILEATQGELQSLQEQINILAGEKDRIKEELRSFLNTYLAQIDGETVAPTAPVETVAMDQAPELMPAVADEATVEPALELEKAPAQSA
ncbi:MAG: DivIVA domain-containing protein, partial [Spirochaetales bacterium]|nr:DivIVA domain-containing protein [Spirochaetales bacterium]